MGAGGETLPSPDWPVDAGSNLKQTRGKKMDAEWTTPSLRLHFFKNRTLHLTFLDDEANIVPTCADGRFFTDPGKPTSGSASHTSTGLT